MAQQIINLGTAPAGTDGDKVRAAFQKAIANFAELYPNVFDAKAEINFQTGTTYTLTAEDSGGMVDHANASSITVTLPNNLEVGTLVTYVQAGAGQITFVAASGATLVHRESHTKTAGQWAMVTLYVRANSGTNAAWVLGGDTTDV